MVGREMTREEALELLRGGTEEWNRRMEVLKAKPPDLHDANLSGVNLSGVNLSGADLSSVNLSGADLSWANLGDANLERANLSGADLGYAQLWHAKLRQADIRGGRLRGADLSDADLTLARLVEANLSETDLSETDLSSANLSSADLGLAKLMVANLERANLSGAGLRDANLTAADLRDADLSGADLSGADLSGAKLYNADLGHANLSSVNLSQAQLLNTNFAGVDLSVVDDEQLLAVNHLGPCTISTNSLSVSKGSIPPGFLRGCGLSDWEVEAARLYDPALSAEQSAEITTQVHWLRNHGPIQISPLFVSYSHSNANFVDKLCERFDGKRIRHWRDKKDATAGRLDDVLTRAIAGTRTTLLVLSEASVKSGWVQFEIKKALEQGLVGDNYKLCPIMLDKYWLDAPQLVGMVREHLKDYSVLDFAGWEDESDFNDKFGRLLTGLGIHYRDEA